MTDMSEQNPNLEALSAAGVSVWLNDISRERLADTMYVTELVAPTVCTTPDAALYGATAISTIGHDKLPHALNEHSTLLGLPSVSALRRRAGRELASMNRLAHAADTEVIPAQPALLNRSI